MAAAVVISRGARRCELGAPPASALCGSSASRLCPGGRIVTAVVADGAGCFEVAKVDGLDVDDDVDLGADNDALAGKVGLPGDSEVVAIDRCRSYKTPTVLGPLVHATQFWAYQ